MAKNRGYRGSSRKWFNKNNWQGKKCFQIVKRRNHCSLKIRKPIYSIRIYRSNLYIWWWNERFLSGCNCDFIELCPKTDERKKGWWAKWRSFKWLQDKNDNLWRYNKNRRFIWTGFLWETKTNLSLKGSIQYKRWSSNISFQS